MNRKTDRLITFNRKNILDAADKLFSENSVEKTTMDMLATEAGCSKPTLYGYFKNKDEVFFALVCNFLKELTQQVKNAISSGRSFLDRYTAICESIFQLARRHPLYFEGLIGNINVDIDSESTPVIYKKIYALGEQLNSELEELITAGKEEGLIARDLPSSALLEYLWGGISGIIRMLLQKPGYLRIQNLNEKQFADFCFERLLCGCGPQVNQEMKK